MSPTDEESALRRRQFEVAYEQGRRDADVDARLYSHEKRLNAINGSIDRTAKELKGLSERIDAFISSANTQAAEAQGRERAEHDAVERSNRHSLSFREWIGVGVVASVGVLGFVEFLVTNHVI